MALLVIFMTFKKQLLNYKETIALTTVTLLFAAYLALGGWCFIKIERPQEEISHQAASQILVGIKLKYPAINDAAMEDLFQQLRVSGVKGLPESTSPSTKWTFANSVVYSITLLTTIGYGHLSPLTATGKILTIVYTSIGIPLTLFMMSLYVCRLMTASASYKVFLFQKLKGHMSPVQISFIHVSTILIFILFGCFLIPAAVFQHLEESWTFLDSLYYCFISLTTVGLGDFVPGLNSRSPYVDLYRIGAGIFILYGVIVMMFMLAMVSDFLKHCYDDVTVSVHTEKAAINTAPLPSYGTISIKIPEERQTLLQQDGALCNK